MEITKRIEGLYTAKVDLNLRVMRRTADEMYGIIKESFSSDKSDYSGQSTLTTKLFSKYNFLMYPLPGINELYWNIHQVFHACLSDMHGVVEDRFFIQCWLNYYQKGEFIDWHSHTINDVGGWHGFYCLDVEPGSYTSYKWPRDKDREDLVFDVQSENNLIVMGKSNNDQHRSSEWPFEDRPRITVAFDILPQSHIHRELAGGNYLDAMKNSPFFINHFIPM
jgi:hypothetical protein